MEKKNYITLVSGIVSGLVFALGMCMCLLPEWNMFNLGIVGIVMLLFLIPMCVGLKDNK